MQRFGFYTPISVLLVVTAVLLHGCSNSPSRMGEGPGTSEETGTMVGTPLFHERAFLYKTDTLPSGDIIKRWHWDKPWEVRNSDGSVLRRMYSPTWSAEAPNNAGPHITVIQDPKRGTIYEAFFVQKTEAIFDLPMTLLFFATRESQSPLFSLSFTDSTAGHCQVSRVSRGSIKHPQVPQSIFETAQWIGIGWQSTAYQHC